MTTELDFDKLRAVAKAAITEYTPLQISPKLLEYLNTFNPALVLQLLDLAQRPPASELSKQWRETAAEAHRECRKIFDMPARDVIRTLADALVAAADACDRLQGYTQ